MNIKRYGNNVSYVSMRRYSRKSGGVSMEATLLQPNFKKSAIRNSRCYKEEHNDKYVESFDNMMKLGKEFRKALELSDEEIYKLLKKR